MKGIWSDMKINTFTVDHDNNEAHSDALNNAFHVVYQLRQCAGAGHITEGKMCHYAIASTDYSVLIPIKKHWRSKQGGIIPCFPSNKLLILAIVTVGIERILQAIKTFECAVEA